MSIRTPTPNAASVKIFKQKAPPTREVLLRPISLYHFTVPAGTRPRLPAIKASPAGPTENTNAGSCGETRLCPECRPRCPPTEAKSGAFFPGCATALFSPGACLRRTGQMSPNSAPPGTPKVHLPCTETTPKCHRSSPKITHYFPAR